MLSPINFFSFKILVNCLQIFQGSLNPLLQLTLPYRFINPIHEGNAEEENNQRVTKICRLSLLANSASTSPNAGGGGAGIHPMSTAVHIT
jgi:hypothetical protein